MQFLRIIRHFVLYSPQKRYLSNCHLQGLAVVSSLCIDDIDADNIVELTRYDKKALDGGIKFILLKRVGKAYIDTSVTPEEIFEGIKEIEYREDNE